MVAGSIPASPIRSPGAIIRIPIVIAATTGDSTRSGDPKTAKSDQTETVGTAVTG
jgi:hypothetical protein